MIQSKTAAVVVFVLTILFMITACLLDTIMPRQFAVTTEVEAWGRLFAGIGVYCAFISFGLTLIIIPEEWAEKYIPFYKLDRQVSRFFGGILCIVLGLAMMLLNIWLFMRS